MLIKLHTIFTYIEEEKTLMTCDAFGAHFSYEGITDEDILNREEYISAVKYYYDHILAPFTDDYLSAIEKIENLDMDKAFDLLVSYIRSSYRGAKPEDWLFPGQIGRAHV